MVSTSATLNAEPPRRPPTVSELQSRKAEIQRLIEQHQQEINRLSVAYLRIDGQIELARQYEAWVGSQTPAADAPKKAQPKRRQSEAPADLLTKEPSAEESDPNAPAPLA